MQVFVQDPNGVGTTLKLDSAADIQVRPGFVYTFLDVDPAVVEFKVDGQGGHAKAPVGALQAGSGNESGHLQADCCV